jgi:hypothetical protein
MRELPSFPQAKLVMNLETISVVVSRVLFMKVIDFSRPKNIQCDRE